MNHHSRSVHLSILSALAVVTLACAREPGFAPPDTSAIDRVDVERVLSVLAADSMLGREAFTPSAERAAEFLASEFEAAGLQPVEGADGYLQRFTMHSVTPSAVAVTVDGIAVPAGQAGAHVSEDALHWTTGDAEVVVVGPDGDPQAAVFPRVRAGGDALVLLDPAHADFFQRLAGFLGRPTRSMGDAKGGNLVVALVKAGGEPSYTVDVTASVSEEPLTNVVGMIPGRRSDEFVLFSAHYDHIGIRPVVDGDSIANGANDDASGTTAVVELARYFAARGTPERSILFAAFTAEEGGGYGSRYFSGQLDPDQIVAMFNIEMIGKPAVGGPNTAWITGFERSSFGKILQHAVEGTEYSFYADPYPEQNLFYRSDNATLARLGVPAHSISTTPIDVDPDYHQVSDEIGTLDLDHMTATIRAIAMGAETIISGEATPTRVDPATVN